MNRKLLVVSYHFPPINSAGVLRVTGFIKYLCEWGWDVSVVSIVESPLERSDPSLMMRIPESVSVTRTRSFELDHLLKKIRPPKAQSTSAQTSAPTRTNSHGLVYKLRAVLRTVVRAIYRVMAFPDKQVGWLIPLLILGGLLLGIITMHLAKACGRMHGAMAKAMLVRI